MKTTLLVALVAISAVQGRSVPPAFAPATALLAQYVEEHKIAGAVAAVAHRGSVVYLDAIGLQDLVTAVPMQERSLFRIYSMTKSVTAVAAMMLFEEGRFSLSDPVSSPCRNSRAWSCSTARRAPHGRRRASRSRTCSFTPPV